MYQDCGKIAVNRIQRPDNEFRPDYHRPQMSCTFVGRRRRHRPARIVAVPRSEGSDSASVLATGQRGQQRPHLGVSTSHDHCSNPGEGLSPGAFRADHPNLCHAIYSPVCCRYDLERQITAPTALHLHLPPATCHTRHHPSTTPDKPDTIPG